MAKQIHKFGNGHYAPILPGIILFTSPFDMAGTFRIEVDEDEFAKWLLNKLITRQPFKELSNEA